MPLLGKKVFNTTPMSPQNGTTDAPYLIPHTKERFESKSEFEKRKDLYNQSIWTCRATGHNGLTHEEACKSEETVMEQLSSQFPKCFEKDVLALVHHNTISLETIVDKAWWKINQQFLVGETVNLKVKVADKLIPAKIVSVDKSADPDGKSSTCDSPSSDKENSSDEKSKDKTPKKWVPPKFLPYTYSIELLNESKVIHSVPASDLQRVERSPSKDLLRLFVRVSAIRSGTAATSPWIVNSDLVSQYRLVSKFADFFFSPMKVAEAMKKAEENGKKRKMSNGTPSSAAKKLKLDKSTSKEKKTKSAQKKDKDKSAEKKKKKNEKVLNKSSSTTPKSVSPSKKSSSGKKKPTSDAVVVSSSDSEEDISLAKLKPSIAPSNTVSDSDSDVPLYQLAEQTPKKKKPSGDSSDEDVPLSKITPSTPKKRVSDGAFGSKKKSTPSKKKEEKGVDKKKGPKGNKSDKDDKKKKKKKLSPKKKDGLKQVTLYDLTKKGKLHHAGTIHTTPKKSTPVKTPKSPPKPPPTPAIVRRLLAMKQDSIREKMLYSGLLKKAVGVLSPAQVKVLPDKLRTALEHRKLLMEEKDKMAKMSPEELEAYVKEKKAKAKQAQKQRMLQKLRDQRKRFEDTDLQLTPLPTAKLVPTPDGFPNSLFGEVAMVTEFINCYSGLLMPDSEYPIYTDALMKALVGGASGFTYLSRVLNVLLQTLLQDQVAKGCEELSTQLSDIAVSPYTASELVRLCIRRDEDDDEDDVDDSDVPEEYVKLLEDSEFFELDVEKKLSVLRALCLQVLGTDAVQDYMIEQQGKAGQLTKQKVLEMREMAAQKKSEKQSNAATDSKDKADKKVDSEESKKPKDEKQASEEKINKDGSMSILSFYGKEAKDSGTDDNCDESKDWGSIVKSRRILAAKAAEEKERKEKERAAQREKEFEEERQKERLRRKGDQILEALSLARMVLRQEPIGTDRNHDRYWVFTNTTPGLYVEKGWMGEEVNYKVARPEGAVGEPMSESEEEDNPVSQTGTTPLKVVYKTKRHVIETSMPHPGQNLWFTYRSQKDVDGLLKSLHPQGIRESLLKKEIKARYDDLLRAIIQAQRTNLALRDCDGDKEMVEGFKKELSDMELRLRNGGLGGVTDFEKFEARLSSTTDIAVMGECLVEVKEGILEKFLQGFMRPVVKSDLKEEEESEDEEEETKEDGEEGDDKPKEKEHKREKVVREWKEAIETCQTMSRLHVLMAILDSCIKWEKSAENAKCKICRKKCDDAKLLLCDECNQAFHMYCLRPAINKLPTGDWFCPACKPRRPQVRHTDLESESEEEEKEEACRECGGRDKLIHCTKCPAAFHTQCHDPPLRHPPRGVWECTDCKSGVSGRRKGKLSRKVAPRRNYRQLAGRSEDEDDEEEEEEEEEESEEETQTARSSRSRSSRSRGKSQRSNPRSTDRQRQTASASSAGGRGSSSRPPRNSRGGGGDLETTPPSRTSRRGPSELSLCEDILQKVMKNKSSWPFLEPVDKKAVPDYHALIKKPMDFQTMQKKCARLSYASPQEFIEDAALVFENAESYNKSDSEVYACMQTVEKQLKDLMAKVLPDWTYYRTVLDKDTGASNSSSSGDSGRRRSRK